MKKLRNIFYFLSAVFNYFANELDKIEYVQRYYVYVPTANKPVREHCSYESASKEALRLATEKVTSMEKIQILQIVKEIDGTCIPF